MTKYMILVFCAVLLTGLACQAPAEVAHGPRLAERSGVYHVASNQGGAPMVTLNHRVYVQVSAASTPSKAAEKIASRNNNVYAAAVNTEGVSRATQAVHVNGRVLLRSPGSIQTDVHLAQNK